MIVDETLKVEGGIESKENNDSGDADVESNCQDNEEEEPSVELNLDVREKLAEEIAGNEIYRQGTVVEEEAEAATVEEAIRTLTSVLREEEDEELSCPDDNPSHEARKDVKDLIGQFRKSSDIRWNSRKNLLEDNNFDSYPPCLWYFSHLAPTPKNSVAVAPKDIVLVEKDQFNVAELVTGIGGGVGSANAAGTYAHYH